MNSIRLFTKYTWKRSCGYLAQNTAQVSGNALASGSCDNCSNRGLAPNAIYFSGTARAVRFQEPENTGRLAPHR